MNGIDKYRGNAGTHSGKRQRHGNPASALVVRCVPVHPPSNTNSSRGQPAYYALLQEGRATEERSQSLPAAPGRLRLFHRFRQHVVLFGLHR